jgi:radical SAM-linked protein
MYYERRVFLEQLVRVKYCKNGPIKYISHLNLVQVFTRALRRANIPMSISSGFNPRFRISFGPPLPLGISSISEYLDIKLKKEIIAEELVEKLNRVLPQGLTILKAKILPSSTDSLVKIIDRATYIITLKVKEKLLNSGAKNQEDEFKELNKEMNKNIKRFVNLEEIIVEKQTKNGIKMVDIRPLILDIKMQKFKNPNLEFNLDLKIGQQGNLNPRYVAQAWISYFANNFDILKICRNGLYIKDKEVI